MTRGELYSEIARAIVTLDDCPLCEQPKPVEARCCNECRAALEAVAISEPQAIADARRIKNWNLQ